MEEDDEPFDDKMSRLVGDLKSIVPPGEILKAFNESVMPLFDETGRLVESAVLDCQGLLA